MADDIDVTRRRFVGRSIMAIAAAQFSGVGQAESRNGPRELAAFAGATAWINSAPLAAESLLGKVVLVDFCTYTCINWLRTLPYVRAWAQKDPSRLVVIGVHTPEFAFEHDLENVRRALGQMKIAYP